MTHLLVNSVASEAALEMTSIDESVFQATLRSRGVIGSAKVGTFMSHGLAELFEHFANNWKGWEGSKDWRSLEGELAISAQADSLGHVFLEVRLCEGAPAQWTLHVNLVLEAGSLQKLAQDARDFESVVSR